MAEIQQQEILTFKAEVQIRYHERFCFLCSRRFPAEIFLPPDDNNTSTLLLAPPWILQPGMFIVEDQRGFHRRIVSTNPEDKRMFHIPMDFFLERAFRT